MNYLNIRKTIKESGCNGIEFAIVSAVEYSLCSTVTDEEFSLLCSYVYSFWRNSEKGHTQLIADIVVDCYKDCGLGYNRKCQLSLEDLKNYNKQDDIAEVFAMAYSDF